MISIKELAEQGNVTARTLRYYDEIGLLPADSYQGKKRIYNEEALAKLKEIQAWKSLGLSLQQIQELLLESVDYEKILPLLENKKNELLNEEEQLFHRQMKIDDLLYAIEQNKIWNPLDYTFILKAKETARTYSFKDRLFSFVRNMTFFKSIVISFYFMDIIIAFCLLAYVIEIVFSIDF